MTGCRALAGGPAASAVPPATLDLRPFFAYPGRYAVLRLPAEFPRYREHSDLDVLCDDVAAFRAHVLRCGARYQVCGFRFEEHRDGPHLHVDVFHPGATRLGLRFDLTSSVPSLFEKVPVDPALTEAVLGERRPVERDGVPVFVPRQQHELALRLLEYLEWHDRRPDKAKHLDFIDRANDFSFLDVINGYTGISAALDTESGQAVIDLNPKSPTQLAAPVSLRTRPPPQARMDYFMIWGHGLEHTEAILETIRRHPALRIVTVVKRHVPDMAGFVERVYEADTVPMQHLVDKTRYLLTTPPRILFVLVKNLDPQQQYFGEGPFRHIQCRTIKAIKEEVRERFNPRRDGKRTEDHVVHGSDYQAQVRHLLSVLGLPPLEHYRREPNPRIDAPYHIAPFDEFNLREIALSSLRARILGRGDVPLEETPHYRYLGGDADAYRAYHAAHMGTELTDDHFPAAFERLKATFDPDRTERDGKLEVILASPLGDSTYRILDGVHRAALLRHRGRSTVRIAVPSWAELASAPALPPAERASSTPSPLPATAATYAIVDSQIPGLAGLYQLFLGYKRDGCFVEFGAFDGEYVSNTASLADLGWRGLYVEPVPEYHAKCVERHRRNRNVSVLDYAVGDGDADVEIHVGGPLSTASPSALEKFRQFDWSRGLHDGRKVLARQRLLEDILLESHVEPGFDLLVVDVEGYEWKSLRRFDVRRWAPRMVIVELHDNCPQYDNEWDDCNRLVQHLDPHYRIVFKDYTNTVFVRRDLRQHRP